MSQERFREEDDKRGEEANAALFGCLRILARRPCNTGCHGLHSLSETAARARWPSLVPKGFSFLFLFFVYLPQRARPSVWAFQPKLHPRVVWSHAAGKPCARPPLRWAPLPPPPPPPPATRRANADGGAAEAHRKPTEAHREKGGGTAAATTPGTHGACMVFRRGEGTGDWDYP